MTPQTTQQSQQKPTSEQAREQARQVGGEAKTEAKQVAETAKQEASRVADEARAQSQELVHEVRHQLKTQASEQTRRIGGALHGLGDDLEALASGRPEEAGQVGDWAERLASQTREIGGRIEKLGFEGVVDELQDFARRRPGAFLLGAAAAGFAASRLARGAQQAQQQPQHGSPSGGPATQRQIRSGGA